MLKVIKAKLHGIRVTNADLNYHGSVTLDPEQCARAGIVPLEFVDIWNKNNGARLSTYVILGEPGSRCCVLNGAAARLCQPGDELIIAAAQYLPAARVPEQRPKILTFLPDNRIDQVLAYEVTPKSDGQMGFAIVDEATRGADNCHTYTNVDVTSVRADLIAKGLSEDDVERFCQEHFSL
ncbi:aspartate 1-decarboxylase [Magnetospira sp. QH-2]|uniref:aspartate 1-decarboxylase n=1 Tax=Magnetospira sp. (strain QH-2) TaxID=1288970 RepID=UPI0003E80F83|nr:aspartate 1-decarboxylase [Magnetospira sp. QH-2]CCQ73835.1 Aspartate 1-decarboxylase [Magnetospira sp. QH-2]